MIPSTAMTLAAGLGQRMRPLTLDRPKALVTLAGRTLVDHMLDRLAEAGVQTAVVNVHAFADALEARLRAREGAPSIIISNEREALLETGGGVKHARTLLGENPIFVVNIDSVWIGRGPPALARLGVGFDPTHMDALLLLTPTKAALGFDGPGDFFMEADGRLTPRRGTDALFAPYAYCGAHVADPRKIYDWPQDCFSLFPLWAGMAQNGRLFGQVLDGDWMHVGDPAARDAAEARLADGRLQEGPNGSSNGSI